MISEEQKQTLAYYLTKTMMSSIFKEYIDEEQLSQIMQYLQVETQEQQIFFLTQLTIVLREYPDSLFSSPDVRNKLINTVQECLDSKILEENN
jgi:type III secretion system TyeA family effector delivery regulator